MVNQKVHLEGIILMGMIGFYEHKQGPLYQYDLQWNEGSKNTIFHGCREFTIEILNMIQHKETKDNTDSDSFMV